MKGMMFSGKENLDYSQHTKKAFSSKKVALLILSIVAAVSDLALLVTFAISGYVGIIIPILLLILDGLFIAAVCLSNFRFKYSVSVWITYIILTVIVTALSVTFDNKGETFMTNTAKALNVLAHLVLYLAIIFASIYPLFKKNIKLQVAMAVCLAIAILCVGGFATFFSVNGYFGQGFVASSRVVGYTLDEESDTYIATSVKSGRSDRVVIPATFNGKAVTGVDCVLFTDNSINTVEIRNEETIALLNPDRLKDINRNIKIGVNWKDIDVFREQGLKNYEYYGVYNDGMLTFANALYPVNLADDEVYVTFAYTNYPEGDIMPTWIGKKGETFDLSFASDGQNCLYSLHANATSDDDLVWCFDNNDAKILTGEVVELDGSKINDNASVTVKFEDVYRVKLDEDNDDVYEPSNTFKTTVSDGVTYDYRYVTRSTANSVLSTLTKDLISDREGAFGLSWIYNVNSVSQLLPDNSWLEVTDLDSQLATLTIGGKDVNIKIAPIWQLKTPSVTIKFNGTSYVYGDDVKMESLLTDVALNDCKFEYDWSWTGTVYAENLTLGDVSSSEGIYQIGGANPQNTAFTLNVTVSCPQVTSLKAVATANASLTVGKKALNLTWQSPTDMIYSGEAKTVSYTPATGDLIKGDALTASSVVAENLSNTNAGSYTASVMLKGELADKYFIASGGTYSYSIARRSVAVQWSGNEFTYDGATHNPTASAGGVLGTSVALTLSTAKVNAGTYTATATTSNTNYTLTNTSYQFTINQKSVTAVWDTSDITYNGYAQYPRVTALNGLVGNDDITSQLTYTGYSSNIDAGSNYVVGVTLPSTSNYKFDTVQRISYNILRKDLSVKATASNKTYDGAVNNFDFEVVSGLLSIHNKNSLGTPTYSGTGANAVDVGTYSVSVSLPVNDVTKNYAITYSAASFTISQKALSIKAVASNKTYDGEANTFDFEVVSGLLSVHTKSSLGTPTYSGTGVNAVNAGTYNVSVSLPNNDVTKNYAITYTAASFTISKRALSVKAVASDKTYDGTANTFDFEVVSGLLSVHTKSSLGTPTYSGTGVNAVNAGTYSVSVSLPNNDVTKNYNITYTAASFTISKRALSVKAVASDKTYDGTTNTFDFEVVSGLLSVHNKNSLGTPTYSGTGVNAVNAGTYSVSVTLPNNDVTKNYAISYTAASFTISKAQATLVWSDGNAEDGIVTPPSVVTSGQIYSGDITVSGYTYRDSSGNAIAFIPYESGTYTVEVTATSKNYQLSNTTVTFTVTAVEEEGEVA